MVLATTRASEQLTATERGWNAFVSPRYRVHPLSAQCTHPRPHSAALFIHANMLQRIKDGTGWHSIFPHRKMPCASMYTCAPYHHASDLSNQRRAWSMNVHGFPRLSRRARLFHIPCARIDIEQALTAFPVSAPMLRLQCRH